MCHNDFFRILFKIQSVVHIVCDHRISGDIHMAGIYGHLINYFFQNDLL